MIKKERQVDLKFVKLPAGVLIFGLVSFLTDVSSDMIYPLLPVFLTQQLGAGQWFVGLIEGVAESTAAFFTLLSGIFSDKMKDRGKLVLAGYSLSSIARPLSSLAQSPWMILGIRFSDRMGKGIRTSPRDSLIAEMTPPHLRASAYGLHRSMDHLGAVFGPAIATLLLMFWVKDVRHVFALAAIPAALSVALILWKVREIRNPDHPVENKKMSLKFPTGRLRIYLPILFLFILTCSSDAFLLMRAQQLGVRNAFLPLIWMMFNAVKALTTFPLGVLADKIGRRRVILAGWLLYAAVYAGFGLATTAAHAWILFFGYGLFYGLTEGSERAILADYSETHERGQVFGWYYFILGLGSLPASLIFGALWQNAGAPVAFRVSASVSLCAAALLFIFLKRYPSAPLLRTEPPPPVEKD